jgi:hypothetical protein
MKTTEKQIKIQVLKFGTVAETLKKVLTESDRHTSSWTCFGSENIIKENTHLRNKISLFFIETVAIGGVKGFDFCQYAAKLTKKFISILQNNQCVVTDKVLYYEWKFTFTYNVFMDAQKHQIPFGTHSEKYKGFGIALNSSAFSPKEGEFYREDYGNRFNGGTWYFPTEQFKQIPLMDINKKTYKTKAVKDSKDYSFLIVPA